MDKIKTTFADYQDILNQFTDDVINERYNCILTEMNEFIESYDDSKQTDCLKVNELSLVHAILDYFADISRLKNFHGIDRTNEYKILAYEVYWILRRKPIQVISGENEELVFINEKFALVYIVSFLTRGLQMRNTDSPPIDSFIDSLYYYLKYRVCTPQDIEMIVLAFCAGLATGELETTVDSNGP